jgi:hypothetical protein
MRFQLDFCSKYNFRTLYKGTELLVFRTMDKVRKPSNSVWYTPLSEPYRIYYLKELEFRERAVSPVFGGILFIHFILILYFHLLNQQLQELMQGILLHNWYKTSINYPNCYGCCVETAALKPNTKQLLNKVISAAAIKRISKQTTQGLLRKGVVTSRSMVQTGVI